MPEKATEWFKDRSENGPGPYMTAFIVLLSFLTLVDVITTYNIVSVHIVNFAALISSSIDLFVGG